MSQRLSRRRFLQVAGAGMTSVAVLAACPAPSAAPGSSDAGASGNESMESITLTFGRHWEAAFRPHQDEFDKIYMENHEGVEIEITYNTWGDHNQVVPTWAAADQLPDVIYVHGSRSFPWAFEGISISLQDYVDADEEFNVEGIWEESLRLYRFQGEQHAIPYDHGPIILGYNVDLFDEMGIDYPTGDWTFETLREVAKEMTVLDGDVPQWGWSGSYPAFGNTAYGATVGGWGGTLMNEDETEVVLDSPEAREACQFWADLIHVDQSAPTPAEAEAFEQGPWISGRVAMTPAASWSAPTFTKFGTYTRWDVAPLPSGPARRFTGSFGSGYMITKNSNNPDAAWEYLSEYLSEDGMIFMWGNTGRGSPARESGYRAWMESEVAPDNAEFFIDALNEYAVTGSPFQTLAAAEFNDITSRQATLLRSGETDVASALETIMAEGQPVLDEATERLREAYG